MFDDDEDLQGDNEIDIKNVFYSNITDESPDLDEKPLPFYLQNMFETKKDSELLLIDQEDEERGRWDSEFEFLLSCIGYSVGLGNLWRFPVQVYQGGGGSFLLPYITFCLCFGVPMVFLELSLGQFCGRGCSKTFMFCPLLTGLGWTYTITSWIQLLTYSIMICWCLLYFVSSFKTPLPWAVCSNSFNTAICYNNSITPRNLTDPNLYESSSVQFLNFYVMKQQKSDGSYYKINEAMGPLNIEISICLFIVLLASSLMIMFGIKVSGKIIYITVIFPYIAIFQLIILGCTLPGALYGIKFYLYPNPSKLLDVNVYKCALEQLLYSSGVAAGGLMTMSSFNRFRDRIYRNVAIIISVDLFTSLISGFATFPVLGYMSHRTGKDITELINADTTFFFTIFPEVMASLPSSNFWSILFMFMALTLGIDTLIVLLETITVSLSDYWPIFGTKKYKILLTLLLSVVSFIMLVVMSLPGGLNWLALIDVRVLPFCLIVNSILEVFSVCALYDIRDFKRDIEFMTGKKLGIFILFAVCITAPICSCVNFYFLLNSIGPIYHFGNKFPPWVSIISWIAIAISFSPTIVGALFILIQYKIKNPTLNLSDYFNLCMSTPPDWGPKSKRYWVQSAFYSSKLLKFKSNPVFLASLKKGDDLPTLVKQAEKKLARV